MEKDPNSLSGKEWFPAILEYLLNHQNDDGEKLMSYLGDIVAPFTSLYPSFELYALASKNLYTGRIDIALDKTAQGKRLISVQFLFQEDKTINIKDFLPRPDIAELNSETDQRGWKYNSYRFTANGNQGLEIILDPGGKIYAMQAVLNVKRFQEILKQHPPAVSSEEDNL